ncbi:hypothetical protein BP5796_08551 [Coleophoma crateriformis]|uniref:Uncharacterized protein n=1 Tax=Coleophoma crateriformis TaxID=565419 RepID=A0A3D8R8I3_9HELO|nr:hypothetical protein BP5796_08551 [Coleophoma crateriformis]
MDGLAETLINAMPRAVRQVLSGGAFTFDDLWNILDEPLGIPDNQKNWVTSYDDRRVAIYVVLFRGIEIKDHDKRLASETAPGQMYAVARSAGEHKMLVLYDFSDAKDVHTQGKILKIAEHTCVCLFSSWTGNLTSDEVVSERNGKKDQQANGRRSGLVLTEVYFNRLDTLMQVQYDKKRGEVFDFIKRGPPIVVKEISYNHKNQITQVRDQLPTTLQPLRRLSVNENRLAIQKMYGDGIYFKPIAGLNFQKLADTPKNCAMCHVANIDQSPGFYSLVSRKCSNTAAEACEACAMLRRPCVWLNFGDLTKPGGRYKFIRVPIADLRGPQNIEGPSFDDTIAFTPTVQENEDFDPEAPPAGEADD